MRRKTTIPTQDNGLQIAINDKAHIDMEYNAIPNDDNESYSNLYSMDFEGQLYKLIDGDTFKIVDGKVTVPGKKSAS